MKPIRQKKGRLKAAFQFKSDGRGSGGPQLSRSLPLPAPAKQTERTEARGKEWQRCRQRRDVRPVGKTYID